MFSMPAGSEWIFILVIVLIFFGVGKLPDVFKQLGKGVKAFKDASSGEDEDEEDDSEEEESDSDEELEEDKKGKGKMLCRET